MDMQRIGELHVRLDEETAALEAYKQKVRDAGKTFMSLGHTFRSSEGTWHSANLSYPSSCELRHVLRAIQTTEQEIKELKRELTVLKGAAA